jgi:2-hydroxychromene-2-carboxylate isomerase
MSTTLDFYFDFGSPTAYLAHCRLQQLAEQYDLVVNYQPMLLGGVFKATDNMSPVAVPAKGKYMNEQDLPRFCKRYGVSLNFNPHFPINTLQAMRGATAAKTAGCLATYVDAVYQAMWVDQKNIGDPEVLHGVIADAGLDADALMAATGDPDMKAELIRVTEEAVSRGAFGAPTMYIGDDMFFGQDRLDFVEEVLAGSS